MTEFAVAIFPDEAKGRQAADALSRPDPANGIAVRSAALLVKEPDGSVVERKWTKRVPWKAPAGAAVGALIGFLAGPIGAGIGFASGGFLGFTRDVSGTARAEAFLRKVHARFDRGKSALVVELEPQSVDAFGARVEELGGAVLRHSA